MGSVRLLLGALAVCAVVAPSAAGRPDAAGGSSCSNDIRMLASPASASGLKTFDDYTEDTPGPDICAQNAVTNDNEGTITFGLHIHNREAFAANERYGVFLDTDNDPATGIEGADYIVRADPDGVVLAKWDGTTFVPKAELPAAEWAPGYGPVFAIDAAELGDVGSFGFFFYSTDGTNIDYAPDTGAWSYQLAPLELAARPLALDRPRAGRAFSARMTVIRSDLDIGLMEGAIACTAKLGRTVLAGRGSFSRGRVTCTWRLPKSAKGKRIAGTLAVTFQGVQAKRSFAAIVR